MTLAGVDIAVFDTAQGVRAVENSCAHIGSPLDDGVVDDGVVRCPWHGWLYDLTTGEHLTAFGRRHGLRTFPARLDGDDVLVDLSDSPDRP